MNKITRFSSRSMHWALGAFVCWFLQVSTPLVCAGISLSPGAVILTAPQDGSSPSTSRPQFSWTQSVPPATWFYVWVNRNGTLYLKQWKQATLDVTATWTPPNDLPNGNYTWAVQTWNPYGYGPWSAVSSFSIVGAPPGAVTLTAPANYATVSGSPTFSWTGSTPAAEWYYLEIYDYTRGYYYHTQWTQSTSWTPPSSLPAGDYGWWVETWNSDGYGAWSSNSYFAVENNSPGKVTLYAPLGPLLTNPRPVFSWSGSKPAATWYHLWINCNGSKYVTPWTQSTSWQPGSNLPIGAYTWAVQTWNPDGYGPWSSVTAFALAYY